MLPIREDYQTYTPPPWVRQTVCELLESLSAEHVGGAVFIIVDNVISRCCFMRSAII